MRKFFDDLSHRAANSGHRRAIVADGSSLSYRDLYERVRNIAHSAIDLPQRVGVLFGKNVEAIVSDLALSFAGKELVPLPQFFSEAQLSHIIRTTGLTHTLSDPANFARAKKLGLEVRELELRGAPNASPAEDASRIIFTSGTTGQPKGVRLSGRQICTSVEALACATEAGAEDRYLSLLPNALLLEQIAGIYVPLSVGAEIHLPHTAAGSVDPASIVSAAEQANATATVLVPDLLALWLRELDTHGRRGSVSLRFVAVGGAPVSKQLASKARELGLPIYEGYGLSECCSVVAVNRPNDQRAGTVGRPLPGVHVTIEHGGIVVSGPTVMDGYVGEQPATEVWQTGDAGRFDSDGFLIVTGRRDNVIVTNSGRNIQPEWIEDAFIENGLFTRCVIGDHDGELSAIVIPSDSSLSNNWPSLQATIKHAMRDLPDYARPRRCLALSDEQFLELNLLTPNLRLRRDAIRRLMSERAALFSQLT